MSEDVIRILSIDGGGIRGIIAAMVIKALLKDRSAQDVFHMIAGTSTGGIIACGLAKPKPLGIQDIIDLYVDHGGDIFKPVSISDGFLGPKYSPDALMGYLGAEFETTHLSDINAGGGKTELLVPSYAIGLPKEKPPGNTCAPMFFRSWQARGLLPEAGATADDDCELYSSARGRLGLAPSLRRDFPDISAKIMSENSMFLTYDLSLIRDFDIRIPINQKIGVFLTYEYQRLPSGTLR